MDKRTRIRERGRTGLHTPSAWSRQLERRNWCLYCPGQLEITTRSEQWVIGLPAEVPEKWIESQHDAVNRRVAPGSVGSRRKQSLVEPEDSGRGSGSDTEG